MRAAFSASISANVKPLLRTAFNRGSHCSPARACADDEGLAGALREASQIGELLAGGRGVFEDQLGLL